MAYAQTMGRTVKILPPYDRVLHKTGGARKPLVVMKVYADESGIHDGSLVMIIGSYIGDAEAWNKVETCIKHANKTAGRPFHAADCAHLSNDFRGVNREQSRMIHMQMVHIINSHNIAGLSAGIYLRDYDKLYPRERRQPWIEWLKGPYELCFRQYIIELCRYFRRQYPGEMVSIVMEDHQQLFPVAGSAFFEMKHDKTWPNHVLLETIAPYSKEAVNLQTADIIAYETYLMQERKRFNPRRHPPRRSLLALLKNKIEGRCWDEDSLSRWREIQEESGRA
jgi:hypothetical protein